MFNHQLCSTQHFQPNSPDYRIPNIIWYSQTVIRFLKILFVTFRRNIQTKNIKENRQKELLIGKLIVYFFIIGKSIMGFQKRGFDHIFVVTWHLWAFEVVCFGLSHRVSQVFWTSRLISNYRTSYKVKTSILHFWNVVLLNDLNTSVLESTLST